jgi:hypothetical protein
MTTNTKQVDFTKPFDFTYLTSKYSYEPISTSKCKLSNHATNYTAYNYCTESVRHMINSGDWKPILTNENTQQEDAMKKLEDYIKAINKNVPEAATEQPKGCTWCECPDCKAAFSEASDNTLCDFCDEYGCDCTETQETMLEAIKDFTISTRSSVFINEGTYEVYCFGLNSSFKAATDDMMHRLMEAISLLHEASLDN